MRIAVASDHAAIDLRAAIVEQLRGDGHEVSDLGPNDTASVDYPLFAQKVGEAIKAGNADLGILVCGTGIGMSLAANKMPGIRAALCHNEFTARMSRAHNDANILCLGARVLGQGVALAVVDAFVGGAFEGGRHARRVEQITAMEG